jgi:hypothetical protein
MPPATVCRVLKKHMRTKSYRLQLLQILSDNNKGASQTFCVNFLDLILDNENLMSVVVLSDRVTFSQSESEPLYGWQSVSMSWCRGRLNTTPPLVTWETWGLLLSCGKTLQRWMCFSTLSDQKVYEPFLLAKINHYRSCLPGCARELTVATTGRWHLCQYVTKNLAGVWVQSGCMLCCYRCTYGKLITLNMWLVTLGIKTSHSSMLKFHCFWIMFKDISILIHTGPCIRYKIVGLICIHITHAFHFSVPVFLATWQTVVALCSQDGVLYAQIMCSNSMECLVNFWNRLIFAYLAQDCHLSLQTSVIGSRGMGKDFTQWHGSHALCCN